MALRKSFNHKDCSRVVKELTLHPFPFKSREKGSLQDAGAPAISDNVLRTLPPPHTHQKPVSQSDSRPGLQAALKGAN